MSRFAQAMTADEIDGIGEYSARRNREEGISGVLLTLSSLFFQIIEGDDQAIDNLYSRVMKDDRHTDIMCLRTELDITERLFPDWSMRTIRLDDATDDVVRPVSLLIDRMGEAQQIIERYTQPAVSRIMASGLNPLEVPLVKVDRVVVFADMIGFSSITASLPIEDVSVLVTTYLDTVSRCVSDQGGEVTKYLGDGMMAYFAGDQADAAIRACTGALRALDEIAAEAPGDSSLRLLASGFGIDRGLVIEGNLGSSVKMDYTIIGTAVNTASRLEALTRRIGARLVVSEAVARSATEPWDFVELGHHRLVGIENEVAVLAPRTAIT